MILFATLLGAGAAFAQKKRDEHSARHTAAPAAASASMMATGEVRRIQTTDINWIALHHGEIRSVAMPPMTTVFDVRDSKLLDEGKVGDTVLFAPGNAADGALFVTKIRCAA